MIASAILFTPVATAAIVTVAAVLAIALLLYLRSRSPGTILASADAALAAKSQERACQLYSRAASLAAGRSNREWVHRAWLGLGAAEQARGRQQEAFDAYNRAAREGATLPEQAWSFLQHQCEVQEAMKAAARKPAAERCREIISHHPEVEWAHYFLGLACLLDGKAEEAGRCFQQALSLKGSRALTQYWLCVCELQQSNVEGAAHYADRFLALQTSNPKTAKRQAAAAGQVAKALLEQARAQRSQALLARAVPYLKAATEREPGNAAHHFDLGCACLEVPDAASALISLAEAARLAPNEKSYVLRLGIESHKAGRPAEALDALIRALALDERNLEARRLAAAISLQLEDNAAAEAHARKYLELQPGDAGMGAVLVIALWRQNKLQDLCGFCATLTPGALDPAAHREAFFLAGRAHLLLGRAAEAVAWLQPVSGDEAAGYYYGCALAHSGRLDQALSELSLVAAGGGPRAQDAQLQRAHVLALRGDAAGAESAYRGVLQHRPDSAEALRGLASLAAERQDYAQGLAWMDRALAIAPDDAAVRFGRAMLLEQTGQLDAAAAAYREVPADPALRTPIALRLGIVECRRGNFGAAIPLLDQAAGDGEPPDAVLFYRGGARISSGSAEEGVADWKLLLARHPEDERLLLNCQRAHSILGAQLAAMGRLPEAIAAWEQYLAAYPNDGKAAKEVAALHFRLACREAATAASRDGAAVSAHLEQALARDPEDSELLYHAALANLRDGKLEQCEQRLRGLAASGRSARVLFHLALCLQERGAGAEAVKLMKELEREFGHDEYALRAASMLANQDAAAGRHEAALERLAALV